MGVAKPPRDPGRSVPAWAWRWRAPAAPAAVFGAGAAYAPMVCVGVLGSMQSLCPATVKISSRPVLLPTWAPSEEASHREATSSRALWWCRARHGVRELQGCGGNPLIRTRSATPLPQGRNPIASAVGLLHSDCTSQAGLHQASHPGRGAARSAPILGDFHMPASAWLLSRWPSQCTLLR